MDLLAIRRPEALQVGAEGHVERASLEAYGPAERLTCSRPSRLPRKRSQSALLASALCGSLAQRSWRTAPRPLNKLEPS